MDRRHFITSPLALAASAAATAQPGGRGFPRGFLWGAATAGHQIEGNNTNSDFWLLENVRPTVFREPSGDATGSLRLWRTDQDLARTIGLNSYRFSLEWARIEPEEGQFSLAMLDFYKAMVDGCRQRNLRPVLTFNHWTLPRWFAARGGWTAPDAAEHFARFCDRAARHLGDGVSHAITLNEANGLVIGRHMVPPEALKAQAAMLAAAAKASGTERFVGGPAFGLAEQMQPQMLAAHRLGRQAIKAAWPKLPVGASLAVIDDQAEGTGSQRDAMRQAFYGAWFDAVRGDEFVGVQNYGRVRWGAQGRLPVPKGALINDEGDEVVASSLANAVRHAHQQTGRPILVTEHGINTSDDQLRARFIVESLTELQRTLAEGVALVGYTHWSLTDNYEWASGYAPKFGLATVDRKTFARTPKPSAWVLAAIARRNTLDPSREPPVAAPAASAAPAA
jgi:beta-glucosidase